ncbi:MAG: chromosomal replication initiator protein DnaA [Clostridiales Family XIII bacterium]|jgi:chromosomal replication initiator protein|nr:chromosomal replication initiator protein DnaA [Clostridiales Family XIII bacterium]
MTTTTDNWDRTLALLEKKLEPLSFSAWIQGLTLLKHDASKDILFLAADTEFKKAQLEMKYREVISFVATEVFGKQMNVQFLLPNETNIVIDRNAHIPENESFPAENMLNPRYTFETFIEGDNSRFAKGAALAVAEAPGNAYSPLFIYGDSGLGKTHLMNAIGLYIINHFSNKNVLYISSEAFTNEYVNASQTKKMNDFKVKYRNVDVLLLDDIQFISEKEKTIEEVFYTYETLYKMKKQMVFTSDRAPKDLLGLDERLISRLSSGLIVDIQPPAYEIKVAILNQKAELDGIALTAGLEDAIAYIAENIKSSIRELEGAFNSVVAHGTLGGIPITKALAKSVLKNVIEIKSAEPSTKDIKKVVASYFNISVDAIDSAERTRAIAQPRQIAMYLCRTLTSLSFPKIGKAFGKDSTTVIHAYNKIKDEVNGNENLKEIIDRIAEKIESDY